MSRTLTTLLVLVLSSRLMVGQGGSAADRARAEALEAFRNSREYLEAQKRWPAYGQQIDAEVRKQAQAVAAGGARLDERISQYEKRAVIEGTPVSNYLAGRILRLAGRLDRARSFFERSVSIDRFFYWGHYGLGTCFSTREMPESAARHYRRALDLNPKFVKAARGLALCQMQLGKPGRARGLDGPRQGWLEILLRSAEVARRREAARILSASHVRHPELDKGFLQALKDKDHYVRTVAIKTIARWWGEAEQLDDPRLVKILSILLNDRCSMVRGSAAAALGRAKHARAVPPLMKCLQKERDPYVFRQLHRALNRLSFAYIDIPLEGRLDADRMEALTLDWRAWYDANIRRFRRYEGG